MFLWYCFSIFSPYYEKFTLLCYCVTKQDKKKQKEKSAKFYRKYHGYKLLDGLTCSWCWWWWYIPGGVGLSGWACLCLLLDCCAPLDELKSSGSLLTPAMPVLEEPSCLRDCGLSGSGRPPCRLWPGLWDGWLYWWRKWCSSPPPAPSPPSMRFVEPEPEPGASCTSSFWPITPLQQSVENRPLTAVPFTARHYQFGIDRLCAKCAWRIGSQAKCFLVLCTLLVVLCEIYRLL